MKITSLEPQAHTKNRFNMYVDGKFHSGLLISTAASLGLYENKEVTAFEIANIDVEEEYQKCMTSALLLASRRMQSEKEYWQKLGRRYDKAVIGTCLDRLRVLGYADDKHFAEMWVRERSLNRGVVLLRQELTQKGVDKHIVEDCLGDIADDFTIESAKSLALRRYKPQIARKENFAKIVGYLNRRGYSYDTAKSVFNIIDKTTD
ncbi:MAG: regulatory protein RecX [bacterium]